REKAVNNYVIPCGLNPQKLEAVIFGKEAPVNPGHDESACKENRRVEINYEAVPPLLK
ncbi:peptidoglycan-associated lipoprotein, partial [Acinetobacter baumannii]|nr:peptidoglycan-associated lipoprotein [Acinetobacter baumannii]